MANLTSFLSNHDATDIDCVIFRLSENVHSNKNGFYTAILNLLDYISKQMPNAEIIMTTGMWIKDTYKDAALAEAAQTRHLTLIYPKIPNDLQFTGAYVVGDDKQYHQIADSGVAGHVNDVGFMKFANTLANTFGYSALDELHRVTVIDANNLGYTCLKYGVYNGVFSVKAQNATSVTAVDANSNNLVVTARDNGVYTFDFPNTDVTITIS